MAIDRMALFERSFPKFKEASSPLRGTFEKVFAYAKDNGGFFPGLLSIGPSNKAELLTWFDDREEICHHVVPFGSDGLQALYGFWLPDATSIDAAPVIYLEAERPKARVLTRTFGEFLALSGLAKQYLGRDDLWSESETDEDAAAVEAHRAWLRIDLGVEP